MTEPQPQPASGGIPELIATIGTFLTFTGTVTESTWLPGFQPGVTNRRLLLEDHGVQVKTIVGSGWAADIRAGDTVALRGPIKGYEIGPRGLVILLGRTRPIQLTQPADTDTLAASQPAWPPGHTARARRRYRSRHDHLLRPDHSTKNPGGGHGTD